MPPPSPVSLHLDRSSGSGSLTPCPARTSCVSTSSFLSPSQYLPPWTYEPLPAAQARRQLLDELKARRATILRDDAEEGYLAALVPYTLPGGREDMDVVEFRIVADAQVVLFRSEAQTYVPPPPFCFTPGCVSGPGNRARMEALRDSLGWNAQETDEEKKWVPILLH